MGFFRRLKQEFKFSCQEPLTYPYGCVYTSLAQLLLVVAWSLSLVTIYNCYFINARPIPEPNEPVLNMLGYGLMIMEGGGEDNIVFSKCGRYTDFQGDAHIDVAWSFGTAFAWMAMLFGGCIALFLLTTCCLVFHNNYVFKRLAGVIAICFCLQLIVFVAYANTKLCGGDKPTEYICEWGSGSGLNLAAAVMWLLAAFMIFFWPVDDEPIVEDIPQGTPRKPQQQNLPALTMGEPRRQSQQELPRITNGPKPGRKSTNLRLTNQEHNNDRLRLANQPHNQSSNKQLRLTDGRNTGQSRRNMR